MTRIVYAGERPDDEPGLASRVVREIEPPIAAAVSRAGGTVVHRDSFGVEIEVEPGREAEVEAAIDEAVGSSLMDVVHRAPHAVFSDQGLIRGGVFVPPVP